MEGEEWKERRRGGAARACVRAGGCAEAPLAPRPEGPAQVAVAAPFLAAHPGPYLRGSFDLGRVFMRRWSVNLNWLPEEVLSLSVCLSVSLSLSLCLSVSLSLCLSLCLSLPHFL